MLHYEISLVIDVKICMHYLYGNVDAWRRLGAAKQDSNLIYTTNQDDSWS